MVKEHFTIALSFPPLDVNSLISVARPLLSSTVFTVDTYLCFIYLYLRSNPYILRVLRELYVLFILHILHIMDIPRILYLLYGVSILYVPRKLQVQLLLLILHKR